MFLLLTLEGVAGSGTDACWCPELFVEEGTVSVGGDHKFSLGVQDLKGTGNKGSGKWHRLAFIVVFLFSHLPPADLSLCPPFPAQSSSFPVGSRGREGNL